MNRDLRVRSALCTTSVETVSVAHIMVYDIMIAACVANSCIQSILAATF